MKKIVLILCFVLVTAVTAGWFWGESKSNKAFEKLSFGMSKAELDKTMTDLELIKTQVVDKRAKRSEASTRQFLKQNTSMQQTNPSNLLDVISIDGSVKVFSYHTKTKSKWPNGWTVHFIAVFYDTKNDKVLGYTKMTRGIGQPKGWEKEWGTLF